MPTPAGYAVEQVSGYVSLVLTILILTPQVLLNCRRQSTSGLSSSMMVQFLIASLLPAVFYAFESQPAGVTVSWFAFGFMSIVVMCQIAYYRPEDMAADGLRRRRLRFASHLLLLLLASAALSGVCYGLFVLSAPSASFSWLPAVIGSALPTVLTTVGYLSQIRLIVRIKSSAGLSAGFIALDIMAAVTSLISVGISGLDAAVLVPILAVLLFQLTLASLYVIFPPREEQKGAQLDPAVKGAVGMVELRQEDDNEEDLEAADGEDDEEEEEEEEEGEHDTVDLGSVEGEQYEQRLEIALETLLRRDELSVPKRDLNTAAKAEELPQVKEEEKVQDLEAAELEGDDDEEEEQLDSLSASDRRLSPTVSSSDDSQQYHSVSDSLSSQS